MSQDLQEALLSSSGFVVILFEEHQTPGSQSLAQELYALGTLRTVPILRLSLSQYRLWANAHGIYGTPAVVAYRDGQPLFRLLGRITATTLLAQLRTHGL